MDPDPARFTPRELAALGFFDRLAYDHTSIGADTYRELSTLFTTAEIVELGYLCAFSVGVHRLMHTWDLGTEGDPVLQFDTGAIDRAHDR
jgi:alkylhydroperoxidase family enzyme